MKQIRKSEIRGSENQKKKRRSSISRKKIMLGTFSSKLDRNTSIISLAVISLITLSIVSGWFNIFNISGVFKQ